VLNFVVRKFFYPANAYSAKVSLNLPTIDLKKFFGNSKDSIIYLQQFFNYHLSRKAEGNGPMKP